MAPRAIFFIFFLGTFSSNLAWGTSLICSMNDKLGLIRPGFYSAAQEFVDGVAKIEVYAVDVNKSVKYFTVDELAAAGYSARDAFARFSVNATTSHINYKSRVINADNTHGDGIVPFIKNKDGFYVADPDLDGQNDNRNPFGVRCELVNYTEPARKSPWLLNKKFQISELEACSGTYPICRRTDSGAYHGGHLKKDTIIEMVYEGSDRVIFEVDGNPIVFVNRRIWAKAPGGSETNDVVDISLYEKDFSMTNTYNSTYGYRPVKLDDRFRIFFDEKKQQWNLHVDFRANLEVMSVTAVLNAL